MQIISIKNSYFVYKEFLLITWNRVITCIKRLTLELNQDLHLIIYVFTWLE